MQNNCGLYICIINIRCLRNLWYLISSDSHSHTIDRREGHCDGLGFVGEGGEDYSGLERDAVDGLQGKGYYEVEGSEAAGNRYKPAETAGQRQEEGVYHVESVEDWYGPHCGCGHEPVHAPYQDCRGEEAPLSFHTQAAGETLQETLKQASYLSADVMGDNSLLLNKVTHKPAFPGRRAGMSSRCKSFG